MAKEINYSKLRKMGYGRVNSFFRNLDYIFDSLLSAPYTKPIELDIEENISELEKVVIGGHRPKLALGKIHEKIYLTGITSHLDVLSYNPEKKFSSKQKARYKKVIELIAEKHPVEENPLP